MANNEIDDTNASAVIRGSIAAVAVMLALASFPIIVVGTIAICIRLSAWGGGA